jgi:hypothetical protein
LQSRPYLLAVIYVRLSMTSALNSDSANILLAGSEMLHGNLPARPGHGATGFVPPGTRCP